MSKKLRSGDPNAEKLGALISRTRFGFTISRM